MNINKQTIQCKKKQKEVTFSEDSLSDESNSDSDKSIRMGLNDDSFTIEHFINYYENPIIELRNENNVDLQYLLEYYDNNEVTVKNNITESNIEE